MKKVHFTTASGIATAAINAGLSWKEQLLLFLAIAVSSIVMLIIIPAFFLIAGGVGLVAILATISFTWYAVMSYSDSLTYIVVLTVCFGFTQIFAKVRTMKPRKFFDWLARCCFWYFTAITVVMVFAGISWTYDTHGWPMAAALVLVAGTLLKLWGAWEVWPQVDLALNQLDVG